LQDGPEISYDQLVLALVAKRPLIWYLGDILCLPFRTITDAYRLEERLRVLEESEADKILVAIVGLATVASNWLVLADRPGGTRFRLIELTDKSCGRLQSLTSQQLIKPWKRGVFD